MTYTNYDNVDFLRYIMPEMFQKITLQEKSNSPFQKQFTEVTEVHFKNCGCRGETDGLGLCSSSRNNAEVDQKMCRTNE